MVAVVRSATTAAKFFSVADVSMRRTIQAMPEMSIIELLPRRAWQRRGIG